jgi:hypothetical protein
MCGCTCSRDGRWNAAPCSSTPGSGLAAQLGCAILDDGAIQVSELGQTTVPGVYAAGDTCRTPAMPYPAAQVIMAAAQGARAAVVIDQELLFTDFYTTGEPDSEPVADIPATPAGQPVTSAEQTTARE